MTSSREAVLAFAMACHPRLGVACPASTLPEVILRKIALYVGLLPTVAEALAMTRAELRTVISRTTRKHIRAHVCASRLIVHTLLPLTRPDLTHDDHKALYAMALRDRDIAIKRHVLQKQRATAVRRQLALCPKTDVHRLADLLQQLRLLSKP